MMATGLAIAATLLLSVANVVDASAIPRSTSAYAPVTGTCPTTPLVRAATGLSTDEANFRTERKKVADAALKTWLTQTNPGFGYDNITLPTIGLTTSGGGYRSLLLGAGVIQGLDNRDSNIGTSGLYQALSYQAGLSGGAWLLSSLAGNNYPTVTSLKKDLWEQALQDSLLVPEHFLVAVAYGEILNDILSKDAAGFSPTLTDPYGRLLSYQLLDGNDGGVARTLSSVASLSNFTGYRVPYPVILSLGVKTFDGECLPGPNGTTYEFTPYEFGSWDSDVSAFTPTKYLGTSLSNGQPTTAGKCVTNYDNLGYVLGTSSNLFNQLCVATPEPTNSSSNLEDDLAAIVNEVHAITTRDEYGAYPNPFYGYASSSMVYNAANPVSAQTELHLADGGEALQNNPIFPLLQPARAVDVLLVNDNSADTANNYPNGSEILTTYVQSFNHNLTRMPFIPSVETFVAEGLNTRATFFGCNATDKTTIVYLPNVNYTYASNTATSKIQYSKAETDAMIANGLAMANQGGAAGWSTCLGCAIMQKAGGALPTDCTACFEKYCYYGS